MSMDIGDWSLAGTAPGFVKQYCRGVRRILKRNQSKRNRPAYEAITSGSPFLIFCPKGANLSRRFDV